jgi:hypothetical protein
MMNEKIQFFLDAYNELGGKINRFIQYVEKEWKRNIFITRNPQHTQCNDQLVRQKMALH